MVRGAGRKRSGDVIKDHDADWMKKALCVGVDPTLFFPSDIEDKRSPQTITPYIEFVCGRCPVMDECREFAITYGMIGIWGGTTDYTRTQLNKKTYKQRCPGCRSNDLMTEYDDNIICKSCGLSWKSF